MGDTIYGKIPSLWVSFQDLSWEEMYVLLTITVKAADAPYHQYIIYGKIPSIKDGLSLGLEEMYVLSILSKPPKQSLSLISHYRCLAFE